MTQSRKQQVSLEDTPFYHCYVRCVRRAFLCGSDKVTGENFDHRKQWIVSRLKFLSYVYAIDICAYAVMDNHYHVVLHVDKQRALDWSYTEVAERWMQLYSGDLLVDRWLANPNSMSKAEEEAVFKRIDIWRERLYELGWFMRGVNETVARMANKEENCHGRFWEGRFKSQALLDEAAVLSCMAYVDLNPIRAGIENDTFTSDFTSIQQRLYSFTQEHKKGKRKNNDEETLVARVNHQQQVEQSMFDDIDLKPLTQPKTQSQLMPFSGSSKIPIHIALPFTQADYFHLVDTTGRVIRENKKGFIPSHYPPILQRLGIDQNTWLKNVTQFEKRFGRAAGSAEKVLEYAKRVKGGDYKGRWCKGIRYINL